MYVLVPRSLWTNDHFRRDMTTMFSLPGMALSDLVKEIQGRPSADPEDFEFAQIAEEHTVPLEDLVSAATVLIYIARRVARSEEGFEPDSELRVLAEELEAEIDFEDVRSVVHSLLGRDTPYQRAVEAEHAFHLDPGYEGVSFDVMLRPRREGAHELVAGVHWTVMYHEQSGDSRSFSFQLAEAQVQELIAGAQVALEQLDALRTRGPLKLAPPMRQD